jgi:hypothetical protein
MKLGEMLVRDGRLTEAQLQAALAHQVRDGGRLGTVLFELGLVDLEALTVYLGLELGIPIATGAALERAKGAAVRLLQPGQAFRYKCVPLVIQDRQLIAAIEDPHDFANLEALSAATGYRVLPRVCPEARIYYYIERYYGVARPARFHPFGDRPRGVEGRIDVGLPAPPLPGLPPVAATPIVAPGPSPRLRTGKPASERFDDSEALELEAEDLLDTLDADSDDAAEAATQITLMTPRISATMQAAAAVDEGGAPLGPPPLIAEAALAELATAEDRNQILEVLLGFAITTFDAAVIFTVREHLAFGARAIGAVTGYGHVEHVLIPLSAPSVLQAAAHEDELVIDAPIAPSTVNTYLYKVLGCAEPRRTTVGRIAIGKRIVNLLYGHRATPLDEHQLAQVGDVCRAAAEAYARLIASSKQKK